MSRPDSSVSISARSAAAICAAAAFVGGLYMGFSQWFEMVAFDLVGGGKVGDFIGGVVHAPIAASIPFIVARQPRLLHLLPFLAGKGRHVFAVILFLLGWTGPFGPLSVLAVSALAIGYFWASFVPYEAGIGHRFAVALAGLGGFAAALLILFVMGIPPISALMIFPMHLGLWLGLRRLKALALAAPARSEIEMVFAGAPRA